MTSTPASAHLSPVTPSVSLGSLCSDRENDAQPEKNLAFFFDEGQGYLFVKYAGKSSEGQVMLVRSVADGQLYIRKVSWPNHDSGNPDQKADEVNLSRTHSSIPRVIESNYFGGMTNDHKCKYTSLISQYCNGGDLRTFAFNIDRVLPPAFLWHLFERLLTVLHHLHYECPSPVAHRDVHPRNIFLHWEQHDNLPQVFLDDFGAAEVIKFPKPTGLAAFGMQRTVRHDYLLLERIVKDIVRRQQNLSRVIPDNLLKLVERFNKTIEIGQYDRDQPQQAFERNKHQIQRFLQSLRYASKVPIAAYREEVEEPMKHVVSVTNRPDLGTDEDTMMMLHPLPIGPCKIVEVDTQTFEILGVRAWPTLSRPCR